MPEHFIVVEGLEFPARLSGHAALDFCNTRAGWDGPAVKDYLRSYDHLAAWAGFVGLLAPQRVASLRADGSQQPEAAEAVLEQARQARARCYRVLRDPTDAQHLDRFEADLHAAAGSLRLRRVDRGTPTGASRQSLEWEIDPEAGLAAPLLAATWAATQLLVSPQRSRLRACPGPGCGWLFLDQTGRRRWCTMAVCGNRQKARRFAARNRATGASPPATGPPALRRPQPGQEPAPPRTR